MFLISETLRIKTNDTRKVLLDSRPLSNLADSELQVTEFGGFIDIVFFIDLTRIPPNNAMCCR